MNREILFRGKRLDNGEWIEGFYVHLRDGKGNESHRIYTGYAETDCGDFYPDWFEVDPATVGRHTGLTDKNGVKIFEGDIISADDGCRDGASFQFEAKFGWCPYDESEHDGYTGFYFENFSDFYAKDFRKDPLYWLVAYRCTVIGNIHDNPELLKEAAT